MDMFGDNNRLHPSYLSGGSFSSLSLSSSEEGIPYPYHFLELKKSSLHANHDGSSWSATNRNTLVEQRNSVNRMINPVDPINPSMHFTDDTKVLSSDPSLNGMRRRSHRPRGCRGGRKNRKSQQAKAQALLPKEILDDVSTPPNHSILKPSHQNIQLVQNVSSSQLKTQAEQSTGSILCAGGLPFMSQSYSGATAFSTNTLAHNNGNMTSPLNNYVDDRSGSTSSPPLSPTTEILPPINFIHVPRTKNDCSTAMHVSNDTYPYSLNVPSNMPSNSHAIRANHHKLTVCTPLAFNTAVTHNMNIGSKLPPKAPLNLPPLKNGCNFASAPDNYQNIRLQKQRQMMPNGGSLFATSPRSFLLGGPSPVW